MATKTEQVSKNGGARMPSKDNLYARVANHLPDAIDTLVLMMKTAKQESVRVGAAKSLLDKGLPDMKAMEMTGEDNGPIKVRIIEEVIRRTEDDE